MQTGDVVSGALLLIVNFFGIIACGYCLCRRLLRVRKNERFAVLVPLRGTDGAAERLYAMHLRLRLSGESCQGYVVALDLGLSEQQREGCVQFCRCTENMEYCTPETLPDVLKKLQKET